MNILFYSEEGGFGGHEVLTCLAAEFLLRRGHKVGFIFNRDNERLARELVRLEEEGLRSNPLPVVVRKAQYLRSPFQYPTLRSIRGLIRKFQADVVVVAQGRIESGTVAFLAARREGVKLVSYIPMAHAVSELCSGGGSVFGRLVASAKDWLNAQYYRMPDGYITISESIEEQLHKRGVRMPIEIVYNPVQEARSASPGDSGDEIRRRLALGETDKLIVQVGRVDFFQKRQDWLLHAIKSQLESLRGYRFLIVGEGPESQQLQTLRLELGLTEIVDIWPWSDNVAALYAAADALVLTSRYEGVPLVMLEALQSGTAVVSTQIPGVSDWLPPEWMYKENDPVGMAEAIQRASSGSQKNLMLELKRKLEEMCHPEKFCLQFEQSLARIPG